ncbi:aminotransferase class III-fold pyridoxal phosphate-dependent enzyme [Marinobacter nanhaiticus D15-8W]|uniref:Aminotransferase class III-fold pyridoxal phosphate-dependent enzyme n=1 Tax=Marinobacter nanhaiticus D15-8W TaxID=626887 RepID=N6WWF9_9GAMM|nr:aminotransferase class III-fold pyridoxal phosphate-dependent enzyme [Marinobacter nanhaiticus]ENO15936.1 aminotransferase class III-fold pyridoxal phosphate-dependent enzyme [Marinobacter nanhaiticus D15-8W]BES73206.1 aminotransferase class III-fold pyridoxal phosphate-dependent enzyme [Marinobacter nanhaiticus D15-8W]
MNTFEQDIDTLRTWDRTHVWHHLTTGQAASAGVPMFVRGEGLTLWDSDGKEYLDASAGGVWVTNVGYGRKEIADAVYQQLMDLNYFAGSMASKPAAAFAEKLLGKMPGMSRVYYSSSGSEANEKAFKMVRQIAHKFHDGKKHKILYRDRDYHGTTLATLSASGQAERREQFGPFMPGFVEFPHCCEYRSQFGDVEDYGLRAAAAMEEVILQEGPDTVGAVIIEPITAGGGIIPPPSSYLRQVREICDRYDLLLIMDEVVCGLGRTGAWFGYQHYDVVPDIVTMAKGVASGYAAISCTVTTERVYEMLQEAEGDTLGYFRDISTFGGCLASQAAALANLNIIEREGLVKNSARQGERLLAGFRELADRYALIGDVRGKGLFLGIELVTDRQSKQPVDERISMAIAAKCKEHGLLIGRTNRSLTGFNNILNFSPALTITEQQVDIVIERLDRAFHDVTEGM